MLGAVRDIYAQSKKRQDNVWTEWVSRPPAAVVVWALRPTPVTPNQVTFLSLGVFVAAAAVMVGWPGRTGLLVAWALMQASYVLDCADGQLARLKSQTSPVGALLDFLMDEVKAFLLIAAATTRLYLVAREGRDAMGGLLGLFRDADRGPVARLVEQNLGAEGWLLVGLVGLVMAATGIALTTFTRRPEYLEATGARPPASPTEGAPKRRSPVGLAIGAVEWAGKLVLHYPSWFLVVAVLDRLDVFVVLYLAAHALYLGRTGLAVLVKLGRPPRAAAAVAVAAAPAPSTAQE